MSVSRSLTLQEVLDVVVMGTLKAWPKKAVPFSLKKHQTIKRDWYTESGAWVIR